MDWMIQDAKYEAYQKKRAEEPKGNPNYPGYPHDYKGH